MSLAVVISAIVATAIVASWLVVRRMGWRPVALFWMFYILIVLALVGTWIDLHLPE